MWYINRFIRYVIIGTIRCLWYDLCNIVTGRYKEYKNYKVSPIDSVCLCYQDFVTACSMRRRAKKQRKEKICRDGSR